MPTWIRVRDRGTGAEFDIDATDPRLETCDAFEVLTDYPENSGPGALSRPAKPRTDKTGTPQPTSKAAKPAAKKEE